MRTFMLLTLAALSLFTYSCKKDKAAPKDTNFYLSASKEYSLWYSDNISHINPSANGFSFAGHRGEEHLIINLTTGSKNQYTFDRIKTYYFITVGQDAVVASYILDDSKTSTANVNTNQFDKTVTGSFTLYFTRIKKTDNYYPDNITFSDGKFRVSTPD